MYQLPTGPGESHIWNTAGNTRKIVYILHWWACTKLVLVTTHWELGYKTIGYVFGYLAWQQITSRCRGMSKTQVHRRWDDLVERQSNRLSARPSRQHASLDLTKARCPSGTFFESVGTAALYRVCSEAQAWEVRCHRHRFRNSFAYMFHKPHTEA